MFVLPNFTVECNKHSKVKYYEVQVKFLCACNENEGANSKKLSSSKQKSLFHVSASKRYECQFTSQ